MPEWLVTVISLVGSTIITTIVGIIVKKTLDKRFKEHEDYIRLKDEEMKRGRLTDVELTMSKVLEPVKEEIHSISKKLEKVEDGTLSTLRNDILTCYYKCFEKGYRNDYDYQNMHHMYDSYAELHGNSYVADVMDRFDVLPSKEQWELEQNKKKTTKKKVLNEGK